MKTDRHLSATLKGCVLAICGAFVSACYTIDNVKIEDKEAPAYFGSVIVRPEAWRLSTPKRGHGGFELSYERYSGSSEQAIASGHAIAYGSGTIAGPQIVDNSADIAIARFAYNHLSKYGSHFELEPSFGLAYLRRDVATQSRGTPVRKISSDESSIGISMAIVPRWVLNPHFGVEVRLSVAATSTNDYAQGEHMALVVSPTPSIALRAGYYLLDTSIETSLLSSQIGTKFAGPMVSFGLQF